MLQRVLKSKKGKFGGSYTIMATITMVLTQDVGLFPMVYGRKNLFSHSMGIIPEVFIHELHGNVDHTQWEHFPLLTHLKLSEQVGCLS